MKKRKKNHKFLPVVLLFIFIALTCASEPDPDEALLFSYINSERLRAKLGPLVWDEDLFKVAASHAKDMAEAGRMDHKGTDGSYPSDRVRKAGIYASKVGENVARDSNVVSAHTMLMRSLEHRENMLNPAFTHAAVAVVSEKDALYITELFARKIKDYSMQEAKSTLLLELNGYRTTKNMRALVLSEPLSLVAQEHVEMQEKLGRISASVGDPMFKNGQSGTRLVSVYTTDELLTIPGEVQSDLELGHQMIGIGVKKVRDPICSLGCYLVVLIFS